MSKDANKRLWWVLDIVDVSLTTIWDFMQNTPSLHWKGSARSTGQNTRIKTKTVLKRHYEACCLCLISYIELH